MTRYSPYSHSKLGTYETCPRLFAFKYIEKPELPEEPPAVEALLGTVVHDSLEFLYRHAPRERDTRLRRQNKQDFQRLAGRLRKEAASLRSALELKSAIPPWGLDGKLATGFPETYAQDVAPLVFVLLGANEYGLLRRLAGPRTSVDTRQARERAEPYWNPDRFRQAIMTLENDDYEVNGGIFRRDEPSIAAKFAATHDQHPLGKRLDQIKAEVLNLARDIARDRMAFESRFEPGGTPISRAELDAYRGVLTARNAKIRAEIDELNRGLEQELAKLPAARLDVVPRREGLLDWAAEMVDALGRQLAVTRPRGQPLAYGTRMFILWWDTILNGQGIKPQNAWGAHFCNVTFGGNKSAKSFGALRRKYLPIKKN